MHFALDPKAEELVKRTGIDERILLLDRDYRLAQATSIVHMTSDLKRWIADLSKQGFYAQEQSYPITLHKFIINPKSLIWKKGFNEPTPIKLPLSGETTSLFILSGIPLRFAFNKPPNYKEAGFNSFSEMTGTIGAHMWQSKIFKTTKANWKQQYNLETGYGESRWNGVVRNIPFHNLIENNQHQDTYVHQYNMAVGEIIDPFGNKVLYKPIGSQDWGMIKIAGAESSYLIIMLQYADAMGMHDEIKEQAALIEKEYNQTTVRDSMDMHPLSSAYSELNRVDRDNNITSYSISIRNNFAFITPDNELALGNVNTEKKKLLPELIYTKEDILPAIKGIMHVNRHGRSLQADMIRILQAYCSEEFSEGHT